MGEYDDIDDDLDNEGDDGKKNPLRPVLKAKEKELKEALSELKELRKAKAATTVADLLKDAQVEPKYARFYTSDDTSKEAVASWIEENAELIGKTVDTDDDTEPEVVEAAGAIARATSNAPQTKIGSVADLIDRINSAKTPAEKDAAFKAAGLL